MKRASGIHSKGGTLSRLQARKAVLGVKAKRSTSVAKKATAPSAKKASSSFVERYLGHFGVGRASVAAKKGGAKKDVSSKKSSAKKGATIKSYRRAS